MLHTTRGSVKSDHLNETLDAYRLIYIVKFGEKQDPSAEVKKIKAEKFHANTLSKYPPSRKYFLSKKLEQYSRHVLTTASETFYKEKK